MMKHIYLCIATLFLMVSCGNPEASLKKAIVQFAADKVITQAEMDNLAGLLEKTSKNVSGVQIGTEQIKTKEDLIAYLQNVKGCEIEGLEKSVPVAFDNFYIFLENSVSMKGYVGTGNPNFAEPILALFECGDENTVYTTAYSGAKGIANPEVVFNNIPQPVFLSNITGGKFISGEASPLDKMITEAVNKITPESGNISNDVFCFITDGILSGTNAEIAANREFTKNNLPLLEKRIRDAFSIACKRNMHCVVYRLETPFMGTYFDYKNGHHAIKGDRPYFMIIVGHKENLAKIENRLAKESNFTSKTPERFASYDVASLKTLTDALLRTKPGQNGVLKGRSTIEYDGKQAINAPVVFVVQVNLNTLPAYYCDVDELHSNLTVSYKDNISGTDVKIPYSAWPKDYIEDVGNNVYRFTISLEPEVIKKMNINGEMCLSLPGHQIEWYRTLACSDDTAIMAGDRTTFALDKFMGGIMKGFGYEDMENLPDAINFRFNVKRK